MSWPDDQAFNEAVQNPALCFADAELRSGMVAAHPTGLPRVMSGNFASVYKIKCPQRIWAVRCFRREITDQQARYAAIGEHLRQVSLPHVVRFEFLREGIRVGGRWFPIIKMEWIEGQCLDQYVKQHLDQPAVLLRLSRDWLAMTQSLQRAQVAHGDLQNGNVLVVGGALKLIDYDGMYVPALAGRPSSERGHPDFQHPARSGADFGLHLDTFSAWVVFSSLLALSVAPYLWEMLNAGGDKLLFGRDDFADPRSSPALAALRQNGSAHLARLADELEVSLHGSPKMVRPLDALYVPRELPSQGRGLPEWIREQVGIAEAGAQTVAAVETRSAEGSGAEWLIDHLVESASPVTADFARWLVLERLCALAVLLTAVVGVFGSAIGAVTLGVVTTVTTSALFLLLILLITRYGRLDVVQQRIMALSALKLTKTDHRNAQAAVEQYARKLADEEKERRARVSQLQAKINEVQKEQGAATLAIQRDTNSGISVLAERRRTAVEQQAKELSDAITRTNLALGPLTSQINSLAATEKAERARSLQAAQDAHITACLSRVSISGTYFSQIGRSVKDSLKAAGITTAADVSQLRRYKVYNIGTKRKQILLDWRAELEKRARQSMPQSLSSSEDQRIRSAYASRAKSLQAQIADHRTQLDNAKRGIQSRYQAHIDRLDADIALARARSDQQIAQLRAKCQTDEQLLCAALKTLNDRHASERAAATGNRSRLERVSFQARVAVAQAEREIERFRSITFLNYLSRILGLRQAG